jgi:hypothetical protein
MVGGCTPALMFASAAAGVVLVGADVVGPAWWRSPRGGLLGGRAGDLSPRALA